MVSVTAWGRTRGNVLPFRDIKSSNGMLSRSPLPESNRICAARAFVRLRHPCRRCQTTPRAFRRGCKDSASDVGRWTTTQMNASLLAVVPLSSPRYDGPSDMLSVTSAHARFCRREKGTKNHLKSVKICNAVTSV